MSVAGWDLAGAESAVEALGEPKYRARQILQWLHRRDAASFEAMTDLPAALRERLAREGALLETRVASEHRSPDGTTKYLIALSDGDRIETVLIPDGDRRTLCISTQVGCPMACIFCASGLDGLRRNLGAHEIVEQVLHVKRRLPEGERLGNVVVMGIGEPLLNYANLTKALRILRSGWGAGIGYNRITLSTVGLIDRVKQLITDKVTPNLAVSLHASDDATRRRLVPTMKKIQVDALIEAGVAYKKATGKEVTFEYVLLGGVNDTPHQARELARRVRGTKCKVNVIPWNRVPQIDLVPPTEAQVDRFVHALGICGVPVTVRKRKGDEVAAACGQLRARFAEAAVP